MNAHIRPSTLELNFGPLPNIPLLDLKLTNVAEVIKLIMNISDCKAAGDDEISVRFLKMAIEIVALIICQIINLNKEAKIVPQAWKTAIITPSTKVIEICSEIIA